MCREVKRREEEGREGGYSALKNRFIDRLQINIFSVFFERTNSDSDEEEIEMYER